MKALATLKPSPLVIRGAAAAAAAVVTTASILVTAPFASADTTPAPVTTTFNYAGGYQAFVVPADVWRVSVVVTGAGGGDSIKYNCSFGHGGAGGVVRGSFAVTPGSSISLFTGEGGHTTGASGKGSPDGSVHGGSGGAPDDSRLIKAPGLESLNGGGGGGSSSVWWNHAGVSDLMVVAGGGGGAGGTGDFNNSDPLCGGDGGAGGNPAQAGYNGTGSDSNSVHHDGGAGGRPRGSNTASGFSGWDAWPGTSDGGGGGGGAGWIGGGGGGVAVYASAADGGGGGAGGTSGTADSVTDVSYGSSGGSGSAGSVQISYLPTTHTSVSSVGVAVPGSNHVAIATAVVAGSDGGGTVAFSQVVAGKSLPLTSCAQQPLVADGSVFTATCRVPSDTIQGSEIDAYYSGDGSYGPSQGTSTINWVGLTTTTTTLSTSINSPTNVGDPVTLTAQTGYFDGNGTTTFFQDGVNIEGCTDKSLTGVGALSYTATCELDGIPTGHHTFTATYAGDDFYAASSATMPFTVNDAGTPLHILGTLPDTAYVGVPYDFQLIPTGVATPTVLITSGALPDGLTLDPNGRIYGTPTTPGVAHFDLTAVNGSASPATVSYTITVQQGPGFSGDAPDSTGVGQAYQYQYSLTGQPAPTVSMWSGALPPGLTVSTGGLLSGTPTTAGTYAFTLRAANAGGSVYLDDSITVAGPTQTPPGIGGTTQASVALGAAYGDAYRLTGTPLPTVQVTGGALPPGIALSQTGVFSGKPTALGTYAFTVTASNGVTPTATHNETIVVTGTAPSITGTPTTGGVGEPYRFAFTRTGNPLPVVVKSTGSLPDGLTLSSAGVLSGTPSRAGTFAFSLSAGNGVGVPATKPVTLVILPKPVITSSDVRIAEGNSGTRAMTFTVRTNRASTLPVTVYWQTANGTALAGSDYDSRGGTVTIPAGSTTGTLKVWVRGDTVRESDEYFWVKLSYPSHATLGVTAVKGVIANDD